MGQEMSDQERDGFEFMTKLLQQHGKSLLSHDIKILLKWASVKLPGATESTGFTTDLWDKVGVKLWDLAVKEDKEAAEMYPSWRIIFEVLTAQEKSHAKDEADTCPPSTKLPLPCCSPGTPLINERERDRLQSVGVFAAGYCPEDIKEGKEEEPLDPIFIDSDEEPNLYTLDSQDNRVHLKHQALREGELDIAGRIVAPVIYSGTQKLTAQWEPLSFSVIKELQRTLMEHGISSWYFVSLLDSAFAAI
ncbi:hypothetical protein Nmel_006196 [Mimus melanotis]